MAQIDVRLVVLFLVSMGKFSSALWLKELPCKITEIKRANIDCTIYACEEISFMFGTYTHDRNRALGTSRSKVSLIIFLTVAFAVELHKSHVDKLHFAFSAGEVFWAPTLVQCHYKWSSERMCIIIL